MAEAIIKTKKMPKQARAKARIEAILAATNSLLKEGGVDHITTTAIAKKAAIPVGSVYQYFEDKNDILGQLYGIAYGEVEAEVGAAQANIDPSMDFAAINKLLLQTFWQAARAHPTFRALTRWANREHSFVEVTPGIDGGLAEQVQKTFDISGIVIEEERQAAVMHTTVTIISVLVDTAIEEEDEQKAAAIIDELVLLLTRYFA